MNHTLVFAKSNALAKVIVYKSCDELFVLKKSQKKFVKKIAKIFIKKTRKNTHQKNSSKSSSKTSLKNCQKIPSENHFHFGKTTLGF